jgi:predicted DNA-binding transcriptional regulator YafY
MRRRRYNTLNFAEGFAMKTASAATRLFTLIMLLQREPHQKAADLAESLGISVRSLHRYIAMLDEMGIPVYSERGPLGGFSLVRGFRMPPLIFSPAEAAALALGAGLTMDMWGSLYDDAARSAMAKLEHVLPDDQLDEVAWARRSLITPGMRNKVLDEYAAVLVHIRDALRGHRRMQIAYQGGLQAEPTEREITPYVLAFRRGWWYAIGYCHLREAVRTFRVDRIHTAIVLEKSGEAPTDFDPLPYLQMESAPADAVHAQLRFDARFTYLATTGQSLWEKQEPQPDGTLLVQFALPSLEWAASFALSFGPAVTVETPPALREMVAQWAVDLVARYGK